jgi:uncharacterized protein YgfB (UPF0149 family)
VTPEKLKQQFIDPGFVNVSFADFEAWLKSRAQALADQANEFLAELTQG